MAYNGRYSIALRILLLKQYLEANAGRNRYVSRAELEEDLDHYELKTEIRKTPETLRALRVWSC